MKEYREKTELEKKLERELEEEAGPEEAFEEADGDADGNFQEPAAPESEQERLLADALAECEQLRLQLLRARADFDNYRKRMAREAEQTRKKAAENLIRELLPVVDNLERALDHAEDRGSGLAQGVDMVLKQFAAVLQSKGLDPIPAAGEPFDPNVHEALAHQPSEEIDADTVIEEYQRGYRLGDFVLRPSKVVVSSGPAPQSTADE